MKAYSHRLAWGFFLTLSFSVIYPIQAQKIDWGYSTGSWVDDNLGDLFLDTQGNVFATGSLHSNTTLGDSTYQSWGGYLTKMSSDGDFSWVKVFGDYQESGRRIAVDPTGNVFLAGSFNGSFSYEGIDLTRFGGGTFIMQFDPEGNLVFLKDIGAWSLTDMAVAPDGSKILLGRFSGTISLGDSTYQANRDDILLVQVLQDGSIGWSTHFEGRASDLAYSLAISESGIYTTGYLSSSSINIGQGTYDQGTTNSGFLIKLDLNGRYQWGSPLLVGTQSTLGIGLAVNSQGELYVAGEFWDGNLFSEIGTYIAKYTADGTLLTSRKYFGNTWIRDMEIRVADDDVYLAAPFSRSAGAELPIPPTSQTYYRALLIKYNELLHPQYAMVGSGNHSARGEVLDVGGNSILWGGHFISDTLYVGDLSLVNNSGNRNHDFFFVKAQDTTENICPDLSSIDYLPTSDSVICEGESVTLSVSEHEYGLYYQWYRNGSPLNPPGSSHRSIEVSLPGSYHVVVNEETQCHRTLPEILVAEDTSEHTTPEVAIIPLPSLTVTLPEGPYCTGTTYDFSATTSVNTSIAWQFPSYDQATGLDSTQAQVMWSRSQPVVEASVAVTDLPSGCVNTQSFSFPVSAVPDSRLTSPQTVCVPDTTEIKAALSADWTYAWSGNNLVAEFNERALVTASSADTTQLYLTVVDTTSGCSSSDTLLLISHEVIAAVPGLSQDTTLLCEGDTLALEAQYDPYWRYQWLTNASLRGDSSTVVLSNPSTMGSEVTLQVWEGSSGCTHKMSFWVKEIPLPVVSLSVVMDTLVLEASPDVAAIHWFVDSTEITEFVGLTRIQPEGIGDFYAVAYTAEGCTAQTEVFSTDEPLSVFTPAGYIKVYPNPATHEIKIEAERTPKALVLLSLSGQIMTSSQEVRTLDLNGIAPGAYLLQVQFEEYIHYQRITKK
ncbi:MAG: T9SS type A sorting domain-containing protein [Bacteroidota bacterium]